MLPTFVIGLREGLEASLIVGIIAAFLGRQQHRAHRDALRQMWLGVGVAVLICAAVGVALNQLEEALPQKEQEGLETVIGLLAVGMVTYMILWMRSHARQIKGHLEGAAAEALDRGSATALVLMAFLAVLREGFETAVFLLATFEASGDATSAGVGAALGVLVAVIIGYLIYRGGVRFNMARFFKGTGIVLVLVAAGLVMNAMHTGHEAGWFNVGQHQMFDLSWLVEPGSVRASVLTGVLGLQPQPTVIEVTAWLIYAVPMLLFILWPQRRPAAKPVASAAV